jgi:hypothetical protein
MPAVEIAVNVAAWLETGVWVGVLPVGVGVSVRSGKDSVVAAVEVTTAVAFPVPVGMTGTFCPVHELSIILAKIAIR